LISFWNQRLLSQGNVLPDTVTRDGSSVTSFAATGIRTKPENL